MSVTGLVQRPEEVIGYHGCSREAASALLAGQPWRRSANAYDWLGEGIYFWEYAPYRALAWARECFGEQAAILQATLRLGHCLNLLDVGHQQALRRIYAEAQQLSASAGVPLPLNTARGAHFLDCYIVDRYCRMLADDPDAATMQTVRGCFPEGDPIYPGSKILTEAHVQIAVRDADCILSLSLLPFDRDLPTEGPGVVR